MAKADIRGTQRALTEDAGLRMHERERSVVADGADVTEMIGDAFKLRHERAQIDRPRRRLEFQRGLGRPRKSVGIRDRAIPGRAARELCRSREGKAGHELLNPFVHITEPLLQSHHALAIGSKTEMARLDDAGMHRPNRNLMQPLTFHGQKDVRRRFGRGLLPVERYTHIPESEVEPSTRIGRADGIGTEKVTDSPFEPDCRRMTYADARILVILAGLS